jgi:hypothetical protein
MSEQLSITLRRFNDKVTAMNQTRSKDLMMSADETRSLHAEIFSLLSQIADLSARASSPTDDTVTVNMDGGSF